MPGEKERKLKPELGLIDATSIGVGGIIGAGIFVVTGIAAGLAGPALIISLLIASIIAILTALSFAKLTAWMPREGSAYEFGYRLISPFAGFLAGWMWMLANIFGGAAVSLGFGYYLKPFFPIVPVKTAAVGLCIAFTIINLIGARKSAKLNNMLVAAKILALIIFIITGLRHVDPGNFVPFFPSGLGILFATYYIFFAYGGFARISVIAEEVKDPAHIVPKAMLLSLLISTILYILIGTVAIGLAGAARLAGSSSPLAEAMSFTGSSIAVYIISAGGLLATSSVLLTSILGVSREAYAMARRGALPRFLSRLDPAYCTPTWSILLTGALMIILVQTVDLTRVVAVSTFGQLFYYSVANLSAFKLKAGPQKRFIPALALASCIVLAFFVLLISPQAWITGVAFLAAGGVYYKLQKFIFL